MQSHHDLTIDAAPVTVESDTTEQDEGVNSVEYGESQVYQCDTV